MLMKELADTGVMTSELAQGTWQYLGDPLTLRAGVELGASFIDTAEGYGNEELVGEAIRGLRDRVFIASKVSPRHFRFNDVIRAADNTLRRLRIDHLDLYQLHWPNYVVPISETMSAMERLVETGKTRFIGVSNFSIAELDRAQAQLSSARIVSNQVRYSLLDRSAEDGMLPYCAANRITLLAYSPLATGVNALLEADRNDSLGKVAHELGKTRAQVALNWVVSNPCVIGIFKAEDPKHLQENCGASGWSLSQSQRQLLSASVIPQRNRNSLERLARRILRRALQLRGRDLGNPAPLE